MADLERSFSPQAETAVAPVGCGLPASKAVTALDVQPQHAMTFADLFTSFCSDPSRVRAPKTQMIYDGLLWIASSVWGEDRLLTSIDRAACRRLLEVLRCLPSNPQKRFPALSAVQAAAKAKASGLKSTLSPGSVNGYMAKLRALMKFAVNEGWIDRNPALGLNVSDPVRERDKRLPFSEEQLQHIFNAPIFRGCVDDGWHYAVPGGNRPRRARFWIPLIGLYSGMRLNEICQLDVADIQVVEGVLCFLVRADPTEAGRKRLKTKTSERVVPVHPTLLRLGFSQYLAARREQNSQKLFPELRASATGYFSDSFSKWFRRFLASAGAEAPRTCFHSFRHCFRDALRRAKVQHEIGLALGGWSAGGSAGNLTAAAYGSGHAVADLAEAVASISFDFLDISSLADPPDNGG
nr:site-specific integrase [Brevundimonas sp. EAKA]